MPFKPRDAIKIIINNTNIAKNNTNYSVFTTSSKPTNSCTNSTYTSINSIGTNDPSTSDPSTNSTNRTSEPTSA